MGAMAVKTFGADGKRIIDNLFSAILSAKLSSFKFGRSVMFCRGAGKHQCCSFPSVLPSGQSAGLIIESSGAAGHRLHLDAPAHPLSINSGSYTFNRISLLAAINSAH